MNGKTLRIHVLGNDPQSLKIVELGNWTGRAILAPRAELATALATREELAQPAVYFLLAASPDNPAVTQVYIGEAEDFAARVRGHHRDKDFWETLIAFGSKDANLTKAHIRFLEHWFYDLAQKARGRVQLMNDNGPGGSKLPEADTSDMEEFGRNALFVLGALGYRLFEVDVPAPVPAPAPIVVPFRPLRREDSATTSSELVSGPGEFEITITRNHTWPDGTPAVGRLLVEPGGYRLLRGSAIRLTPVDSFQSQAPSYWNLWNTIISNKEIVERVSDELGFLKVDTPFNSPSAAAAVVRAAATNGRTEWKEKISGQSLKDWEMRADRGFPSTGSS